MTCNFAIFLYSTKGILRPFPVAGSSPLARHGGPEERLAPRGAALAGIGGWPQETLAPPGALCRPRLGPFGRFGAAIGPGLP
jgi:hypothetical protein